MTTLSKILAMRLELEIHQGPAKLSWNVQKQSQITLTPVSFSCTILLSKGGTTKTNESAAKVGIIDSRMMAKSLLECSGTDKP